MTDMLRGSAVIAGAATAGIGEAFGYDTLELLAAASAAALKDAGLSIKDVDGLFAVTPYHPLTSLSVAEYLGIHPRFADTTFLGGASTVGFLKSAAMALQSGECDVALICYGSHQRTGAAGKKGRLLSPLLDTLPYEAPYRPRNPISSYALAAARHMHDFGTTREQLAEVAVAARKWAQLNPEAFMRKPLSIEDVLSSRMLSDPLTVRDCCLVTDGAGAIVLVRPDRVKDLPKPPVYVLGSATEISHRQIASMPDLTVTSARESGRRAYAAAGLGPSDVDLVQLYDAFTINTILFLEDLGFCPKGEGGAFVSGGAIAPGGVLPVNTNGGGLSCCHPGMYGVFAIIEAARQLRGEAGERSVKDADVALVHGNGAVLSVQSTAILGTAATV
ncbi:Acetyl-CoA acetyltransferase [Lutimaribacter pacificus]|uniref:Acetyl-CoA acetyltransferase n=1 Tax=Lutimaribacter pacificus TaxID=391948 RepID=A0A1H0HM54_9RHOB|nr:thiolase [Lutimaribacter pacificus]SDO20288.1 Acetyl-CoA acetyltransferase [Lutimaribacter pacificus]SHK34024.1 Acetyl-CoA acetyltransferase [Lutimaribacter pacificus]